MDGGAMPTNRTYIRHPRRGRLSHEQEMVLLYGKDPRWSVAFRTEEEHRQAWARHRDRILASYRHGRRPMAWWSFESPIRYPGYEHQQSVLFAAGLLTEQERAELIAWWREQYERAWSPNFFCCEGPGRFFNGAVGRRKHYRWADIPASLLREWNAARRRQARTIRGLATTSQKEEPQAEAAAQGPNQST
jgi:hypothetical protein